MLQWLGSQEQKRVARVAIQVLISFTPLPSLPAETATADHDRTAQARPSQQQRSTHTSDARAEQGDPDADPTSAARAEEAVPGGQQHLEGMLERQASQDGASSSDRNAVDRQGSPTPSEAIFRAASGSAVELHAAAEPGQAPLPIPGSSGARIPGSLTFTPAARQQEAAEAARSAFAFAPQSSSGWVQRSVVDFGAVLAAGRVGAGLPRLAEAFPGMAALPPLEAGLGPAAAWRVPTTHLSHIAQPQIVTGFPVGPPLAYSAGLMSADSWDAGGVQQLQGVASAEPARAGSKPQIDALIERAKRLRAQMAVAVGAAAPAGISPEAFPAPDRGTDTGARPASSPGPLPAANPRNADVADSRKAAGGGGAAGDQPLEPVLGLGRSGQMAAARAGRALAAQRKRRAASTWPSGAGSGAGGTAPSPVPVPAAAAEAPRASADRADAGGLIRPLSAPAGRRRAQALTKPSGATADIVPDPSAAAHTSEGAVRPVQGAATNGVRAGGAKGAGQHGVVGVQQPRAVTHAFEVTITRAQAARGVLDVGLDGSSVCYVCYQFPGTPTFSSPCP